MERKALVGVSVVHEYRGRGVVTAVSENRVSVRFGDYTLEFPYPGEFARMLTLKEYDPQLRGMIEKDQKADRLRRAREYRAGGERK